MSGRHGVEPAGTVGPTRRAVLAGSLACGLGGLPSRAAAAGATGIAGVVAPGAKLMRVFEGGRWCEGPVWDRRGGTLLFSDVRANRLLRLGGTGDASPYRDPSDFANGNGFDPQGRLVTCEQLTRRVVRQEEDGRLTVLADRVGGKRLNSPNDLAIGRDGAIWFTDPTFGLTQPEEGRTAEPELPGRYVFRLDPDGTLDVVADSLEQPNGIVFSPDGRTLYVSDASAAEGREGKREVHAFAVTEGRRLSDERVFATLTSGIPDGLAVDAAGRLYAGTDRGAMVWKPDGAPLGLIATPGPCGNLAFGGSDGRRLFLCNGTSIHAIETETKGVEWA